MPGTIGRFERDGAGMWHSMVTCVFDCGGPRLRVGSVQLPPFDQAWGWSDAAQILRAMHRDDVPGFIGGDFNGVGATKEQPLDGGETFYNHDPYNATHHAPDTAVRSVHVVDHGAVGQCTDHAPVILDIDPPALNQ
ncbi:hypothetical protein ABZU76_38590 [Amycolatopsis sp. NPDC005232]|uniref:hypothetical protein n=1 Tax=Amycolatopsis sp. NPDC005232 TaxID=3157027 RepID=UPI00339E1A64